ncbi:FadR family transcriptional regulator [Nitrincola tibetensis]|uniref:Pyruvate dehydrogenase complex repressor n=1 Tax=Nitrincola tibetensis TaxID=2219697 RepID=A0A364NNH2_9GAMM|nr:FCD domain-containing protein [Nitrincola tibetensis]RAU18658.1 FadR family transcriptional regulator [Nitrincola tibetensis]
MSRSAPPAKESPPSRVTKVLSVLRRELIQGNILPGQSLPSQRKLAQDLQVARGSVREAIVLLESEGIVSTHPGGRSQVNNVMTPYFTLVGETGLQGVELQLQVLEARAVLEGEAAYYAALRASDAELSKLSEEYEAMRLRSMGESTLSKAKADLTFHMMIANASHHLIVISFSQLFYARYFNVIHETLSSTLRRYGRYPDGIAQQHEKIHRSIQARLPEQARSAASEHILFTRRLLEKGQ